MSLLLFSKPLEAGMVPSNILTRVFSLRIGSQQGTCFTIEVDGRQYLITARHMVSKAPAVIEILRNEEWVKLPFHLISVEPDKVDIAVLALDKQLSSLLPIQLGIKGSFLSQEVFFVGFPYGLSIDGKLLNSGFPLPLVKHGIISAFENSPGEPFLVDGINNPGFSGSPVLIAGLPSNPTVIGVVSGYRFEEQAVFKQNQKTGLNVQANTGLLIAYSIDYALDAIRKNPIGYRIQPSP
jgi:S1-C subfamily serine protease